MKNPLKIIWIVLGFLCLELGMIGMVLLILPTVPFYMATIAMMSSFGPVVALSSLSNNLNQTLASGERVLSLLEETPLVEEIPGDVEFSGTESMEHEFTGAEAENVTFAYEDEVILDNYSLKLQPGKITGIHGASGSGKSTILKLLMRFWDVQDGS